MVAVVRVAELNLYFVASSNFVAAAAVAVIETISAAAAVAVFSLMKIRYFGWI